LEQAETRQGFPPMPSLLLPPNSSIAPDDNRSGDKRLSANGEHWFLLIDLHIL
jgi:hypothetical protein